LIDRRGEGCQIQLEVRGRRRLAKRAAVVVDVELVLNEERCKYNDFVAGVKQCFQNDVQSAAGPAGHHDLVFVKGQPALLGQHGRHGPAGFRVAGVAHVTVHARQGVLRQFL